MTDAPPKPPPDSPARRFEIEGVSLGYPTEFRDGASAAGMFLVRAHVANGLLAESGFRVAELLPGRGLMALTGVHYTDTDCGTYEETAFAFFVEPLEGRRGLPWLGAWIDIMRGGRVPTYYLEIAGDDDALPAVRNPDVGLPQDDRADRIRARR
jgi:hypothetical protein